jgi:hypothetical protein
MGFRKSRLIVALSVQSCGHSLHLILASSSSCWSPRYPVKICSSIMRIQNPIHKKLSFCESALPLFYRAGHLTRRIVIFSVLPGHLENPLARFPMPGWFCCVGRMRTLGSQASLRSSLSYSFLLCHSFLSSSWQFCPSENIYFYNLILTMVKEPLFSLCVTFLISNRWSNH